MEKYDASIFEEADKLILPPTEMFDFFDFLAGKKVEDPNSETSLLESHMIKFQIKGGKS